jgi:ATP synthase protein I
VKVLEKDLLDMLKKVLVFDLIQGAILSFVIFTMKHDWTIYLILGLSLAYISLALNTYITSVSIGKVGKSNIAFIVLGFAVRVVLVSVIGVAIYAHNRTDMIVYILGYSIQFISLIFYGLTNKM